MRKMLAGSAILLVAAMVWIQGVVGAEVKWLRLKPARAGESVAIRVAGKASAYQRVAAGKPMELTVTGPTKVKLYVRCAVPSGAVVKVPYALSIGIDGKPAGTRKGSALPSRRASFEKPGKLSPGDADRFYVEIPAGKHAIQVASSDPAMCVDVKAYRPVR